MGKSRAEVRNITRRKFLKQWVVGMLGVTEVASAVLLREPKQRGFASLGQMGKEPDKRPHIYVERLMAVPLNKIHCPVYNLGSRLGPEIWVVPAGQLRASRIHGAVLVYTILAGSWSTFSGTEVPFTEVPGGVADSFKQLCHCGHGGVQPIRHTARRVLLVGREMPVDAVARRELARHNRSSRRRTDRAINIKLRKKDSFPSKLIQVGRLDLAVAVTAQICPAQVVGKNKNEIGFSTLCSWSTAEGITR
jgi:hypothetical protein